MMVEGPVRGCLLCCMGTAGTPRGLQHLGHAPGELIVIVRIIDDVAFTGRRNQLAGPVCFGRDDRQRTRQGLEHHQRTRIVERGMHEEVGGEVTLPHVRTVAGEHDAIADAKPLRKATIAAIVASASHEQAKVGPGP